MAAQLWLSAQEASSNHLHLDVRVLTLKVSSFRNCLCAIAPVTAIFLLLAWSQTNPPDWSSFLLATRSPAPLPRWSTCRCRCFSRWNGRLDDWSKLHRILASLDHRPRCILIRPTSAFPPPPPPPPPPHARLVESVHCWSTEQSWMHWTVKDTS